MADVTSKQIQDFLDSQQETLNDLFFRLENFLKNQSKQTNDAIDRLSQILGQKLDRMQSYASSNSNNDASNRQDMSKLSSSIDRLSSSTETLGKKTESSFSNNKDTLGKIFDSVIKLVSTAAKGYEKSFEATSNQLNFNRQMEASGVLSSFDSLREAAKNSGIALDDLSELSGRFSKVMISLNAAGHQGVLAFQKIGKQTFEELQKQNISFTQKEAYEVEAVFLENARRMGRFQDLTETQIRTQTINTAKIIDSIAKLTGQNRSDLMEKMSEGPNQLTAYGFRQLGLNEDQITMLNNVSQSLGASMGADFQRAWESYMSTGVIDEQVIQQFAALGPGGMGKLQELRDQVLAIANSSSNPNNVANVGSLVKSTIQSVAANGRAFESNNINAYAMGKDNFLASQLMASRTAQMIEQGFGQEKAVSQVEHEYTKAMMGKQAQAAVDMQTISNQNRDALMSATDSLGTLSFAVDKLVGTFKKADTAITESISKLMRDYDGDLAQYEKDHPELFNKKPGSDKTLAQVYNETGNLNLDASNPVIGEALNNAKFKETLTDGIVGGLKEVEGELIDVNKNPNLASFTRDNPWSLTDIGIDTAIGGLLGGGRGAIAGAVTSPVWTSTFNDWRKGNAYLHDWQQNGNPEDRRKAWGQYAKSVNKGITAASIDATIAYPNWYTGIAAAVGTFLNVTGLDEMAGETAYDVSRRFVDDEQINLKLTDKYREFGSMGNSPEGIYLGAQPNYNLNATQDNLDIQLKQLSTLEDINRKLNNGATNIYSND